MTSTFSHQSIHSVTDSADIRRNSLFSKMRHPCVLSLPTERETILANASDPLWKQFIQEAQAHFDSGQDVPVPQFPLFCHNGDLDAIMATSVLAYVTGEQRYYQSIATWLRGVITYFFEKRPEWEAHLNMLTAGKLASDIDPKQQGNPRQFFEGFGLPGLYWVEGGVSICILHLYDLIEAYAPDLLTESEKLNIENALTHFATRFAFHEEALKYNNRAAWANVAVLIAGLTHQHPHGATVLLERARRRNQELRATFFDDGSYIEGSHAYHYLAADALALFALLHNHAFPNKNVFESFSGTDLQDRYPSIEKIMEAHTSVAIPGDPPKEHPRGVGAHFSHLPLLIRASMLLAYNQHQNPQIGWLISRSRGTIKPPSQSPMKLTNHTILSLGNYVPLETFWLERLPYQVQLPQASLTVLPEFGGFYSRSGGEDSANSFVWAHYGFHGTGKGQRDCCHVGLSVGGHELVADPFPREGPPCRDSSFCHNTITAGRKETPITIGKLLVHKSQPDLDTCLMINHGGLPPQRLYLEDPREESTYVFDITPTNAPPYTLRRAVIHWHRQALILLDDIALSDNSSSPLDWFFYTNGKPEDYDPSAPACQEDYTYRSIIRGTAEKTFPISCSKHEVTLKQNQSHTIHYGKMTDRLTLTAFSLTGSVLFNHGHMHHNGYRSADGRLIEERNAWFTRIRSQERSSRMLWIWTWNTYKPEMETISSGMDQKSLIRIAGRQIRIHCNFSENMASTTIIE